MRVVAVLLSEWERLCALGDDFCLMPLSPPAFRASSAERLSSTPGDQAVAVEGNKKKSAFTAMTDSLIFSHGQIRVSPTEENHFWARAHLFLSHVIVARLSDHTY